MATQRQKIAVTKLVEKVGNNKPVIIGEVLQESGYSKAISENPKKVTESKGFIELMDRMGLSDEDLAKKHKTLLNATKIEHMVFPVATSDEDIKELLQGVSCKVRKIQHGDTANHVWFFAPDNLALKNALDMAYKIKKVYDEPVTPGEIPKTVNNQFNFYGKEYTEEFEKFIMEKTKAK